MPRLYTVYFLGKGTNGRPDADGWDDDTEDGLCACGWFTKEEYAEEERQDWESSYGCGTYVVVSFIFHDLEKYGIEVTW